MNFGPLNKEGGHRRLNVAVTRARELVELVASVRAADFDLADTSPRGPRLLRDYLAYAERSGIDDPPLHARAGFASDEAAELYPLEAAIAEAIGQRGHATSMLVGSGADPHRRRRPPPRRSRPIPARPRVRRRVIRPHPTARDRERLRERYSPTSDGRSNGSGQSTGSETATEELDRIDHALEQVPPKRDRRPSTHDAATPTRTTERREREVLELRDADDARALPWVVTYVRCDLDDEPDATRARVP